MKDNFDYVPIAVVTGASSGIGLELAKVFAENGYDLMIVADSEKIHTAAEALKGKKCQVEVVQADTVRRPVPFLIAHCVHVWKTGAFAMADFPHLPAGYSPLEEQTYCLPQWQ